MGATLREATLADLDRVAAYLSSRLAGGPPSRYRRFFEYRWLRDDEKPNLGWLIEDDGAVEGFLGAVWSKRRVRGAVHTFCNISSWSVDERHRKTLSLFMMQKLLAAKDVTFTCFSASPRVAEVLTFFKFATVDTEKVLLSPLSGWTRRLGFRVRPLHLGAGLASCQRARDRAVAERVGMMRDPRRSHGLAPLGGEKRGDRDIDRDDVRDVNDDAWHVLKDHAADCPRLGHFIVEKGERRCHVVTLRRGRPLPDPRAFAEVVHASDPALFVEGVAALHTHLAVRHQTLLVGIDARFVSARPRTAMTYRKLRPTMMRSSSLSPADVDALYSELVLTYG